MASQCSISVYPRSNIHGPRSLGFGGSYSSPPSRFPNFPHPFLLSDPAVEATGRGAGGEAKPVRLFFLGVWKNHLTARSPAEAIRSPRAALPGQPWFQFLLLWTAQHHSNVSVLSPCSVILIQLFATLWTVARQSPLSMGFSRQEYWSGSPAPSPGDLPDPWVEPTSLVSPALQADSSPTEPWGKPYLSNNPVLFALWDLESISIAFSQVISYSKTDAWISSRNIGIS